MKKMKIFNGIKVFVLKGVTGNPHRLSIFDDFETRFYLNYSLTTMKNVTKNSIVN